MRITSKIQKQSSDTTALRRFYFENIFRERNRGRFCSFEMWDVPFEDMKTNCCSLQHLQQQQRQP